MATQETSKAHYRIETQDSQEGLRMATTTDISQSLISDITVQNVLLSQKGSDFSLHLDLVGMLQMKSLWNPFLIPLQN